MNLIAKNVHDQNLCREILNSHEVLNEGVFETNDGENQEPLDFVEVPEKLRERNDSFKFKMQDIEQIERGVHCTKGKQLFLTNWLVVSYLI